MLTARVCGYYFSSRHFSRQLFFPPFCTSGRWKEEGAAEWNRADFPSGLNKYVRNTRILMIVYFNSPSLLGVAFLLFVQEPFPSNKYLPSILHLLFRADISSFLSSSSPSTHLIQSFHLLPCIFSRLFWCWNLHQLIVRNASHGKCFRSPQDGRLITRRGGHESENSKDGVD